MTLARSLREDAVVDTPPKMLTKLRTLASLYRELGLRWIIFRLAYAFRLCTGIIRLQFPMGEWSDYENKISKKTADREIRWFSSSASLRGTYQTQQVSWDKQTAIAEADRILNGELKYFSHQFIKTGLPPNWYKDYFSDVTLSEAKGLYHNDRDSSFASLPQRDMDKHWTLISDDANTDIKFIWEPNRFTFAYTLVRAYAASLDEKYPEAFWTLIEDWAEHNPPNTGPNWMDGQEIALRLMAWAFGYFAFLGSPSSTPERKEQFLLYIAAQAERIYKNTSFAIFTHGNHSITEAFGLWMIGLLFPELKHADKYLAFGRTSLEREAREQIFPDGTYSMYSLNYHRFILQIYLYAIRLGDIYQLPFTDQLMNSVTKSIEYLSHIIDLETGEMPIYGSNDGALVLPLNTCDFPDYRPLLQLGWYITKGERLFELGPWDEDIFWLTGETAGRVAPNEHTIVPDASAGVETAKIAEKLSFPHGGNYLLRSSRSHAFIRCTDFTSRPSHADQLHVDLWMHGHNLAIDAGTYLYSGDGHWRNGLARTSVHNTVTVDNRDQMTMLSRFTWTNWSKGKVLKHRKNIWQGEHDGYWPVSHKRTVMALDGDRWLVIDNLAAKKSHNYKLQWLLSDFGIHKLTSGHGLLLSQPTSKLVDTKFFIQLGLLEGNGSFSIVRADPANTRGWRSRYYGDKEPATSVMLEADMPQVTFWSFFGFEGDVFEVNGRVLKVNGNSIVL